jgi:hypothetical protein
MPNPQPSFKPGEIAISGATSEKISNIEITAADTEQSLALSAGLKKIMIRVREKAALKISFTIAESGTKFVTIPPGCTLVLDDLQFSGKTLYYQSPTVGVTVEILELF